MREIFAHRRYRVKLKISIHWQFAKFPLGTGIAKTNP
jgi:hypothetical protein